MQKVGNNRGVVLFDRLPRFEPVAHGAPGPYVQVRLIRLWSRTWRIIPYSRRLPIAGLSGLGGLVAEVRAVPDDHGPRRSD